MLKTSDIAKILAPVWVQYPRRENWKEQVRLWHQVFKKVPYRALESAVVLALAHSPFEPKVSDIRDMLVEMQGKRLEPMQAFGLLLKAVSRFGYYQEERAMEALPSNVAQTAKAMGWQEICLSQNPEALRAHFTKAFDGIQRRGELEKSIAAIKGERRTLLENTTAHQLEHVSDLLEMVKP